MTSTFTAPLRGPASWLGGCTATGTATAAGDYTLKNGDTLSEIAEQYNTSWQRLAQINNLDNPDLRTLPRPSS